MWCRMRKTYNMLEPPLLFWLPNNDMAGLCQFVASTGKPTQGPGAQEQWQVRCKFQTSSIGLGFSLRKRDGQA